MSQEEVFLKKQDFPFDSPEVGKQETVWKTQHLA